MNEALLAALDENPDDLTTWDVLADWLEERGDPRAEFMRLTRDVEYPSVGLPESQDRALRAAQARAEAAWFPDVQLLRWSLVWRHGFVSRALTAYQPAWLTNPHGTTRWARAASLHAHPALRFVRELNLTAVHQLRPMPLRHLRVLRCSVLDATALDDVELPALELAVLMGSAASWPPDLPTPKQLFVTPPRSWGRGSRREWAMPAPNRPEFREWSVLPDGPSRLSACAACGWPHLQLLQRSVSEQADRFGSFERLYEEVRCLRCGAFSSLELER